MFVESVASPPVSCSIQARYGALFRVSRAITVPRAPKELFQLLAGELRGVVDFDVLGFAHYDRAGGQCSFSVIETPTGRIPLVDCEPDETPTAWVYEHQEPLVIPFLARETRFSRVTTLLRSEGIQSLCVLPLRTAHRRLGSFGVGSQRPDAYSPEEVEFLSLLADGVSLAIDNAFHFEALQQEKDRLRMLLDVSNGINANLELPDLLRAISAALRSVMQSDGAGVALLDQPGNQLRLRVIDFPANDGRIVEGEILADDSPAVQAARSRELVIFEGPEKDGANKSVCHVPLISRDRVLGTIGVGRKRPYCAQDLNFLKQVSGQIAIAVENALAYGKIAELKDKLARENVYLEDEIRSELNFDEIIGKSDALRKILQQVETVAPTDSTVLIYGETGTGKELVARAVHDLSARAKAAFVKLNCAAIPTGLLESEMFGH